MFELKVVTDFAAAHRLAMVTDKCENLHGHNWRVEVHVAGERLNSAGVLIDFGEIKSHIRGIVGELDHKFLNDLDFFHGNPSSERIAVHIADRLAALLPGGNIRVSRVAVWESHDACATYIP
jgi:6-pyruvoyltetrahydropterin/6-carboxytetrahydropterin synthase